MKIEQWDKGTSLKHKNITIDLYESDKTLCIRIFSDNGALPDNERVRGEELFNKISIFPYAAVIIINTDTEVS